MRLAGVCCVIALIVCGQGGALAQTPAPNTGPGAATTENPRLSRQLDAKRAAAKKAKRLDCERQAREQKVKVGQRFRFIRNCVARS